VEITGEGVQSNKAIVGRNAFAHEAGIHQDGILKDRRTYEIMRPEDVGVPQTTLVLGKHSGRHALKSRCATLGIEPTRLELDELYKRMIALADRKKVVRDNDLFDLWNAIKRFPPRAKAPVLRLLREETAPADEAGYGHGV
jgi:2-isopropylmalate synthase